MKTNATNEKKTYIAIPVPKTMCVEHQSKNSGKWVNIMVPTESSVNYRNTEWKGFAVRPSQVRIGKGSTNTVYILADATVRLSFCNRKNTTERADEFMSSASVLGRWLKWYRFMRFVNISADSIVRFGLNAPSAKIRDDFLRVNEMTGMDSHTYMNRLPLFL